MAQKLIIKNTVKGLLKKHAGANIRVSDEAVSLLIKACEALVEESCKNVVEAAKARSKGKSFMVIKKDVEKAFENMNLKWAVEKAS